MSQFLMTLGGLTLGGSAAIVALALAGRSTRARYAARWRCWAWILLCLRLAIPFPLLPQGQDRAPIQVDVPRDSLLTQSPRPSGGSPVTAPPLESGGGQTPAQTPSGSGSTPSQSVSEPAAQPESSVQDPASNPLPTASQILFLVWLAGAAAVFCWNLAAHLRFLAYLRRWAVPVQDGDTIRTFNRLGDQMELSRRPNLLTCPGLRVPMLACLFRPALLLPQDAAAGQALELSLLHELTHFRRRDIWLKTLALWVNALHWFNPLAWYMVRLVERDTELACDEEALQALPPEEHAAYGQTILSAVSRLKKEAP